MKILFTLCALMGFAACSSNSSPGGNNNTLPGSVIDGGSYITLSDNLKTLSYIKGSVKHFDSSGNIYRIDEYDRDFGGMFGPQEVHAGLLGRPVFWLDSNSQEQSSKTFVGSTGDTGEVYGYNSHYKN